MRSQFAAKELELSEVKKTLSLQLEESLRTMRELAKTEIQNQQTELSEAKTRLELQIQTETATQSETTRSESPQNLVVVQPTIITESIFETVAAF